MHEVLEFFLAPLDSDLSLHKHIAAIFKTITQIDLQVTMQTNYIHTTYKDAIVQ